MMVKELFPVLETVTVCAGLTVPRFCKPKLRLAGLTLMAGMIGVVILILMPWLAWPAMLVARRVKKKLPAMVGVPVIAPDVGLRFRPGGSPPEAIVQAIGAVPVADGKKP